MKYYCEICKSNHLDNSSVGIQHKLLKKLNYYTWDFLQAYRKNDWPMMNIGMEKVDKLVSSNKNILPEEIVYKYKILAIKQGKITNNSMRSFCSWYQNWYKSKVT